VATPGIANNDSVQEALTYMLQAVEHRLHERWVDALSCIDRALSIAPQFIPWHVDRALVLAELGHYEDALDSFDQFLHFAPPSPEIEALRQDMMGNALSALAEQLERNADELPTRLIRAHLLRKDHQYALAQNEYESVLQYDANNSEVLNYLGIVLLAQDKHEASLSAFTKAIIADPACAEILYNAGNVLQQLGRLEAARTLYQQAINLSPDFAEAHMEIGHSLLMQGDRAGWPHLEWRWHTRVMRNHRPGTEQPLWLGEAISPAPIREWPCSKEADLSGKTILVWAEQGAGDTLQFVRFVPQLLQKSRQVILRVQKSLRALVASLEPRLQVIGDDELLPPHDVHCPLMSLPLALGVENALNVVPYLQADSNTIEKWNHILGPRQGLRIGMAWAGRQFGLINRTRDMPLLALMSLAHLNVELISLQKEIPRADAELLGILPTLRHFGEELTDFSETAAMICNLDLVISVDTAVAHLAAALGKPCWLMLRFGSEWRWQRERADSPWYPTMKIFRQKEAGDWSGVMSQVRDQLLLL